MGICLTVDFSEFLTLNITTGITSNENYDPSIFEQKLRIEEKYLI